MSALKDNGKETLRIMLWDLHKKRKIADYEMFTPIEFRDLKKSVNYMDTIVKDLIKDLE